MESMDVLEFNRDVVYHAGICAYFVDVQGRLNEEASVAVQDVLRSMMMLLIKAHVSIC